MEPKNKPAVIYLLIFVTSLIYAPLLNLWHRRDPVSFYDLTWLRTIIGVGYVLLYLKRSLDPKAWLIVCCAFFFSCPPIIARALLHKVDHNRKLNKFNGGHQ